MGDDGIAIAVAEKLTPHLEKREIRMLIAETDVDYALDQIDEGDFLFILDATHFGLAPGEVTILPIGECTGEPTLSQHHISLLHVINTYQNRVDGYLLGIEIGDIQFNTELSPYMQSKLDNLCNRIVKSIDARYPKE